MEEIVHSVTANPWVALAIGLASLLLFYFLFKCFIKLAIIVVLVAVIVVGYSYIRHPESKPDNFKEAVTQVKTGASKAIAEGKSVYEEGRRLVKKGKEVYEAGKALVGKGKAVMNPEKEGVANGTEQPDEIEKILQRAEASDTGRRR